MLLTKVAVRESLQQLKQCGPKTIALLKQLEIYSISDLVQHYPRTYDDRQQIKRLVDIKEGEMVKLCVCVTAYTERPLAANKVLIKGNIKDASGNLEALWFNQRHIPKTFKPGSILYLNGQVQRNPNTQALQVLVRECEFWQANQSPLQPIYGLVQGLFQNQIKKLIRQALSLKGRPEIFCESYRKGHDLLPIHNALEAIHFPADVQTLAAARKRLIFEELFCLMLPRLLHQKEAQQAGIPCPIAAEWIHDYFKSLPYELTADQKKACIAIAKDMGGAFAMNRLLQGDVGCGKTEVAIFAILLAVKAGLKAAFLVPTEILADQHSAKIQQRLEAAGYEVLLLKGAIKASEKKAVKLRLSEAGACVVIGTHALIQDTVMIENLGLLLIDEQHRFGVKQRMFLKKFAKPAPHCLFLSATPIPRSMMLLEYGDLNHTVILEKPKGRQIIQSRCVTEAQLKKVYAHCLAEVAQGRQVYLVFPLIELSEKLDLQAAVDAFDKLSSTVFKEWRVGLLHGRMPAHDKATVMSKFKAHDLDILISTTVIEVGVDVPNANTMVIFDAYRFGLAQLHQLRGRVGRGSSQAYCFFVAGDRPAERLKILEKCHDGFKLAEKDLALRGPGDVMGVQQSGGLRLRLADLSRDKEALAGATQLAKYILNQDPGFHWPEHAPLAKIFPYQEWLYEALN